MYSAHNWNKQGDNIQPWRTPTLIWNQSAVLCSVLTVASWPACRFLRRQVRWSGIPISFRIFHSLLWSTQSKFDIFNKEKVDVFLELSCFFDDPHAQFRDEARSPCIVLRHGFLKLPSVYAFPPGKSFLLLGTPFLVFWLENHGFSFPDVLCTAHNRVCSWDLVVRDQREKSNRDSSHTLDSMVSLLREKGFLSLSFVLLLLPLCHCRIK